MKRNLTLHLIHILKETDRVVHLWMHALLGVTFLGGLHLFVS